MGGGGFLSFLHNKTFLPGPNRILYPGARQDIDHLFVVTVAQLDVAFPPYYEKTGTYLMSEGTVPQRPGFFAAEEKLHRYD